MNLDLIKTVMRERKITQKELSEITGVPLQTIKCIFIGRTPNPRIDTVQAIEKALGLDKEFVTKLSAGERELFELIKQLDEEQFNELYNFANYVISKKK